METSKLLKTGAIATLAVLAFETWFRVTSLRETEKRQQEMERIKASSPRPA